MRKEESTLKHEELQCEHQLGQHYWESQWESKNTGWDVGTPTPAITEYMSQYANKNAAILIAGCGNAHEAEYLVASGFTNITLIDIAPSAVKLLVEKFTDVPQVKVLCADFFTHKGRYDLMIEQTFFCAITPNRRTEYVKQAAKLLNKTGKIIGLLFDRTFDKKGPPFGGDASEYTAVFAPFFTIRIMDKCHNSIAPRSNSEVFINLEKKHVI